MVTAELLIYGAVNLELAGFNKDIARDLGRATEIATGSGFPLTGPQVHPTSLTLGPLTNVVFALPTLVGRDPLWAQLFVVGLGGLAVALAFRLLWRLVAPSVAVVTTSVLVATGLWYQGQQLAWHPSLVPLAVFAFYGLAWRALSAEQPTSRTGVGLVVVATLACQLHVTMAVLPVLALVVLLARRQELPHGTLPRAALAAAMTSVPLMLGLVAVTADVTGQVGEGAGALRVLPLGTLLRAVAWSVYPGWSDFPPLEVLSGPFPRPELAIVLLGLSVTGSIVGLRRRLPFERLLVANVLLGLPLQALLLSTQLAGRYMQVTAFALLILAARGLDALRQRLPTTWLLDVALVVGATAILANGLVRLEHPHPARHDPCGLLALRTVASLAFGPGGLAPADADARLHGRVCRNEDANATYVYRHAGAAPAESAPVHVAFRRVGESVTAMRILSDRPARIAGQELHVLTYEPAVTVTHTLVAGRAFVNAPATDHMTVTAHMAPASVQIVLTRVTHQSGRSTTLQPCPIAAGADATVRFVRAEPEYGLEEYVLEIAKARRTIAVDVGPCEGLAFVDVF